MPPSNEPPGIPPMSIIMPPMPFSRLSSEEVPGLAGDEHHVAFAQAAEDLGIGFGAQAGFHRGAHAWLILGRTVGT